MLEKEIEQKFRKLVETKGGLCLKFEPKGTSGYPDRIILEPNGKLYFVEFKRFGEKPRKLQLYRHEQLRKLGFDVYVIDNLDRFSDII